MVSTDPTATTWLTCGPSVTASVYVHTSRRWTGQHHHVWSPRTHPPNARLSPPPARRDHLRGSPLQPYPTTSLVARSRTPSPSRPSVRSPQPEYYGSTNLTDRSRSPSPDKATRERGGPAPPVPPTRRPVHPGGERRKRRRRRRGEGAPAVGQMPRVLPSPTVTPRHSPDHINFPRLFTSPSTSPPWSPVTAAGQSFDL